MTALDSKSNFEARALDFGISITDIRTLGAASLATFGAFAFIVPYNGTSTDDGPLRKLLTDLLGAEPDGLTMARYRRLQFEAHTLMMSEAKGRIEQTQSSEPRKVPAPERATRHAQQVARLSGITITENVEPSHQLLDLVEAMLEEGVLHHVGVQKCTSRLQEVHGIKKEPSVKLDASTGTIKLTSRDASIEADVSSDYKLRQALMRRSLAFDQSNIIPFKTFEQWHDLLLEAIYRDPPPGYEHVSRVQILNADRQIFLLMSEDCRTGLKVDASGKYPAEEALKKLMHHSKVQFLLLPLPSPSTSQKRKADGQPDSGLAPPEKKGKGKGKGRRKGKPKADKPSGKGQGKEKEKPKKGLWVHFKGKPLCSSFQSNECSECQPGETCTNGLHVCAYPGCQKLHSAKDHSG
jgi:hypothetical protein